MRIRMLPALAGLVLATIPPVFAQAPAGPSGSYRGTMTCAKLPNTRGPLQIDVVVEVSGATVRLARTVFSPDGRRPVGTETGSGALGADGGVSIATLWHGQRDTLAGAYSGKLTARGGSLKGTQSVTADGQTYPPRDCTITIKR
jgi:hypothetical protein